MIYFNQRGIEWVFYLNKWGLNTLVKTIIYGFFGILYKKELYIIGEGHFYKELIHRINVNMTRGQCKLKIY